MHARTEYARAMKLNTKDVRQGERSLSVNVQTVVLANKGSY